MKKEDSDKSGENKLEGEGSYSGTESYDEHVAEFIKEGKVDAAAEAARRALEGPEGKSLKDAERVGKTGAPKAAPKPSR